MRVLYLFVFIAVAAAYPSGESQPEKQPELQPEQQTEQKNTLQAVEANPQGDNTESEAERAKRFIFPFVSVAVSPFVYSPVVYEELVEPIETRTVVRTVKTAPVVTKSTSVVKTKVSAPFVDVDVDV